MATALDGILSQVEEIENLCTMGLSAKAKGEFNRPYWIKKAECLRLIHQLRDQRLDPEQISAIATPCLNDLRCHAELFAKSAAAYEECARERTFEVVKTRGDLEAKVGSFTPFASPETSDARESLAQHMAAMELLAMGFRGAGKALDWAFTPVAAAAKAVCEINSETEAFCEGVKTTVSRVIDATGLPEAVKKMEEIDLSKPVVSKARELGFSEKERELYKQDLNAVASNVLGMAIAGGVLKGVPAVLPRKALASVEVSVCGRPLLNATGKELKSMQRRVAYEEGIEENRATLQRLFPLLPPTRHSTEFPGTLHSFYSQCEKLSFQGKGLGSSQKGRIKGNLLYYQSEDALCILLRKKISPREVTNRREISGVLFEHERLSSEERVSYMVDIAKNFAKEKGYKSVSLISNAEKMAVAKVLTQRGEKILGYSPFSQGLHQPPLTLLEIAVD